MHCTNFLAFIIHFLILFWAQIDFTSAKCLSLLNLVGHDEVLDYPLIYFQPIYHLHFTEHRRGRRWARWFWLSRLEMDVQLVTWCLRWDFWELVDLVRMGIPVGAETSRTHTWYSIGTYIHSVYRDSRVQEVRTGMDT